MKEKELVTLRKRAMKNGGYSLYLDYSSSNIRTREFLKMYLVPEHSKIAKLQNQETLQQAEAVKAKRILQLQEGRTGIVRRGNDMLVTDYISRRVQFYREQGQTSQAQTLDKIRSWLLDYGKKATLFTLDKDYVIGFVRFMRRKGLAEGTVCLYFSNLNTVFNSAYREDLLEVNPISKMEASEKPKRPESNREYLTFDEVKKLMATECGSEAVKRAFLFSCFTGLRLSDIEALTWDHIKDSGKGLQVESKQIKTQKVVYVPLSSNAIAQLPKRRKGRVFDLPDRSSIGSAIRNWVKRAKIAKHITYHCSRHTYATMLLTFGANLYTVSALLGHTDISTTQIYAKIVDENKRKTVDLIPDIGER